MKKAWIIIIVLFVVGVFAGGYVAGRKLHKPMATIITTIDTVLISNPAPIHVEIIDKYKFPKVPTLAYFVDSIPTPYFVHDTLVIPIEQKVYQSEQYKAWVSGYNPRLDSIVVYNTHTLSTIKENRANNAIYVDARLNYYTLPAMSLELQAGYTHNRTTYYIGAGAITGDALRFYGMAGIRYTLFTKKW